jgi:ribosomal protein S18 acetylase RimI-like enzyme
VATTIQPMTIRDYDEVVAFWQTAGDGVNLGKSDSRENIRRYLNRNRRMSLVARDGGKLVGAILCGHDGRRGLLHHLAVAQSHRGGGLGRKLVDRCLRSLGRAGIVRCIIMVLADNAGGRKFWKRIGWEENTNVVLMHKGAR